MGGFMTVMMGISLVILTSGIVHWVNLYLERPSPRAGLGDLSEGESSLAERLDLIERRLTDVQDVMISVSEQLDRLEQRWALTEPPGGGRA